jgi:long-chain acyl-CoA synthetase
MPRRPSIVRAIFLETAGLAAKTALVEGPRTLAYGGLRAAVDEAARALSSAGIRPLERVALFCPDSIDYVVLSLAVLSLEAAIVPIAPELMADERDAALERIDVHHLIAAARDSDETGHPVAADALTRAFRLHHRTPAGGPREGYEAIRPAFIRFSSGTTGTSKGVVLSHETILARTAAANAGLGVTAEDTVAWVLSMSFHFVVTILLFLRKGATIVLCGHPMPGALADALQRHPVTLIYASPIHYRLLTLAAALTPAHFAAVRLAVATAVRLPAQIAQDFRARFGISLSEAYGIIEAGLPFIRRVEETVPQPGRLGAPLPAYTVRLADDGEVLIRGDGLFDAYFSPWQPRAVCQPDGWFHTGDIGEWMPDGGLRLVGRSKAVINFSGMKVFPQEVEEVINQHPDIVESLVHGEPHPEYGQLPCARVVLRTGAALDETALRAFCRTRLAGHKVPKTFTTATELPKTASGKLRRRSEE